MTVLLAALLVVAGAQQIQMFLDDNEYRLYARKLQLDVVPFDITPSTVALARHVHIKPNAKLVCSIHGIYSGAETI